MFCLRLNSNTAVCFCCLLADNHPATGFATPQSSGADLQQQHLSRQFPHKTGGTREGWGVWGGGGGALMHLPLTSGSSRSSGSWFKVQEIKKLIIINKNESNDTMQNVNSVKVIMPGNIIMAAEHKSVCKHMKGTVKSVREIFTCLKKEHKYKWWSNKCLKTGWNRIKITRKWVWYSCKHLTGVQLMLTGLD